MRKFTLVLSICFAALLASSASAQQIYGDYIESRNADVYTGHCFANAEANLMGDQAIVAWHVSRGEWQGVKLDGLNVVGVAKASGTLGSLYSNPFPAKAVLIVDEKATPEQREALKAFADQPRAGIQRRTSERREVAGRRSGLNRRPLSHAEGYDLRPRTNLLSAVDADQAHNAGRRVTRSIQRRRAGRQMDAAREAQRLRGLFRPLSAIYIGTE
jgi:Protein of unknown function (DUF1326)